MFGELAVELLFTALSRFSVPVPDGFEVMVETGLLFISEEGVNMITNYFAFIGVSVLAVLALWIAVSVRRARVNLLAIASATLLAGLLVPIDSMALEMRTEGTEGLLITIAEDEVINDTVIAAGETIVVDGDVTGDLFAFSRRVVVNGEVSGNLITFAESITIRGDVGGSLLGASSSLEIDETSIGGDLWTFSNSLFVSSGTEVTGNSVGFAETIVFSGTVKKDLVTFAEMVEVSGEVGEDAEVFAQSLNLLGQSKIAGNVRFRGDEEDFQKSDSAFVGGAIEFPGLPEDLTPRNRYLTGDYYIRQLVRLAAAFIAGLLFLWLVPAARDVELEGGVEGLKTAGIGLVAVVSMPIIAVLFAMTLVGLPLAMLGIFFWIALIYFAKIVVAYMLGSMLLSSREEDENLALTLFVGLFGVIVAVCLPGLGGVINFLLTIIGVGMLVSLMLSYTSGR
ncbi:MAG: polymer-forming cytoskeletal protein [Pseudomonadales bacterium]|nr:polymer-forming cytoskeletal protein [Pseudomonadales bacterium]